MNCNALILARQEHRTGTTVHHATCFYYDNLNRLLHRSNVATPANACPTDAPLTGADHLASYAYGAYVPGFNNGRLVKVSWGPNPSQNSDTLAYDAEGRLKKQTRMVNDQTFIYEVTAYDTLDRPTSVKLPSGEVVATTYDEEGVNALTAGATSLISKVGYNERGQSTFLERPGAGPETTLSYYGAADNFRLSGITNSGDGNLPDFSYGNYDAIGNLTQFAAGTDSYTYTYDDLNRLKKVTGAIGRDYTYDLLGNFDSVTMGGQVQDYTYAAGNASRLMSVSNLPLTVDAAAGYDTWGNLRKYTLQGVAYELNFNAENRLASVKVGAAQPTVFTYDADGQRVQTTYPDGTIIYTPFPDYEVEDPPGSGANTVRTTYRLAGQIVAVQTKVGAAAGTFYYTYTDHLGNVTALSWTGGTYVPNSKARYDPFGAFTTTTPTGSNPTISNHGFTGHRHNNTGANDLDLIYMNARYYMPLVGRFISPDTIVPEPGNPQSYNRYVYVRNNPMNFTDPSGHREIGENENDLLPYEPPPPSAPPKFIPKDPPFTNLPVDPANITSHYSMQGFGDTEYAYNNRETLYGALGRLHSGWDIPMPTGTSLFSLGIGTVVCVGSTCGLSSGSGGVGIGIYYDSCACVVLYGHLSSVTEGLEMDPNITTGMVIGESGTSSNEYEHLHLEIRPNENALIFFNPLYFFSPQSLSTIPNEFMNYENDSNPWRFYGYSSESGGSFWEDTLDELWVKY